MWTEDAFALFGRFMARFDHCDICIIGVPSFFLEESMEGSITIEELKRHVLNYDIIIGDIDDEDDHDSIAMSRIMPRDDVVYHTTYVMYTVEGRKFYIGAKACSAVPIVEAFSVELRRLLLEGYMKSHQREVDEESEIRSLMYSRFISERDALATYLHNRQVFRDLHGRGFTMP